MPAPSPLLDTYGDFSLEKFRAYRESVLMRTDWICVKYGNTYRFDRSEYAFYRREQVHSSSGSPIRFNHKGLHCDRKNKLCYRGSLYDCRLLGDHSLRFGPLGDRWPEPVIRNSRRLVKVNRINHFGSTGLASSSPRCRTDWRWTESFQALSTSA